MILIFSSMHLLGEKHKPIAKPAQAVKPAQTYMSLPLLECKLDRPSLNTHCFTFSFCFFSLGTEEVSEKNTHMLSPPRSPTSAGIKRERTGKPFPLIPHKSSPLKNPISQTRKALIRMKSRTAPCCGPQEEKKAFCFRSLVSCCRRPVGLSTGLRC